MKHTLGAFVSKAEVSMVFILPILLMLSLAAPPAEGADLQVIVGPSDIQNYCQTQGQDAQLIGNNAYEWRCVNGSPSFPIYMDQLCRNLTRTSNVIDRLANFNDPERGWECWSLETGKLYRLNAGNFSDYCRRSGYSGVRLVSNDAYGWRCYSPSREDGISVAHVCQVLFLQPTAIDTVRDFYNPYSWECWN
jgi:hypothetical protein